MGRHAPKRKKADPEAIPDPLEPEAPEGDEPEAEIPRPKKKVGRPPKVKIDVELPAEVRQLIAVFPLMIAGGLASRTVGISLVYSDEAIAGVTQAFETWLSSYEIKLTPGWALLGAYMVAIGGAAAAAAPAPPPPPKPAEREVRHTEGPTVVPNGAPPDASNADPSGPGSTATAA